MTTATRPSSSLIACTRYLTDKRPITVRASSRPANLLTNHTPRRPLRIPPFGLPRFSKLPAHPKSQHGPDLGLPLPPSLSLRALSSFNPVFSLFSTLLFRETFLFYFSLVRGVLISRDLFFPLCDNSLFALSLNATFGATTKQGTDFSPRRDRALPNCERLPRSTLNPP